jgi:hypothetical protein
MGLERVFAESGRDLPEGEKKCFLVIPPDSKALKFAVADVDRLEAVELGQAGRVVIADATRDDEYVYIPLGTSARFAHIVLSDSYLSSCPRTKYIVGVKKTEDGTGEVETTVEVDPVVEDVTAKNDETFVGKTLRVVVNAKLPTVRIEPKA